MQQGSGRSMLADIAVRVRARLGDLGFYGCFASKLVFWLAWGGLVPGWCVTGVVRGCMHGARR